ncbi:MAG TPA: zf-HC2 domain-containing protein [Acidimicrobiia bacterium]|nr:zf-HC2 domain-containing protein [Acidimicrobiia bacterium]
MSCSRFRTAISARLDGEALLEPGANPSGVDAAALDAHLATCVDCRAFSVRAEQLHRTVRLAAAPEVPDLTPRILSAIAAERDAGLAPSTNGAPQGNEERALRIVLVAIGLLQIAIALPALILGDDANLPVHIARHLGSFDVALGVGFLVAAWKPQRIAGVLPVVTALVLCLVGSSLLDVLSGATGAGAEAHHATDIAGLVVLWLLSRTAIARPGDLRGGQVQLA